MSHYTVVVTQKFIIEAQSEDDAIIEAENITYLDSVQTPESAQRIGVSIDAVLVS
jgi:hypothetical protein